MILVTVGGIGAWYLLKAEGDPAPITGPQDLAATPPSTLAPNKPTGQPSNSGSDASKPSTSTEVSTQHTPVEPLPSSMVASVSIRSMNSFEADFLHLWRLLGQEEQAKTLIADRTERNGAIPPGVDRDRPFGYCWALPANPKDPLIGLQFYPLPKGKDLLDLLRKSEWKVGDIDENVYPLRDRIFGKTILFLRISDDLAWYSTNGECLRGKLPTATDLGPAKDLLLHARLHPDRMPKEFRQSYLKSIRESLTDMVRIDYQPFIEPVAERIRSEMEQTKFVSLSVRIDQITEQMTAELTQEYLPGSAAAETLKSSRLSRSWFSYFHRGALWSGFAHESGDAAESKGGVQGFLKSLEPFGIDKMILDKTGTKDNALYRRALKTISAMEMGEQDYGIALRGPFPDKAYVWLVGVKDKNSKELERWIRDELNELPKNETWIIKLDHARHGKTSIHHARSRSQDADVGLFGNGDIFVAVSNDVIFFTYGSSHGVDVLKDVLDGWGHNLPVSTPEMQVVIAPIQLFAFFFAHDQAFLDRMKKTFPMMDREQIRIRLSSQSHRDAWRARLEVDLRTLKLLPIAPPTED